ncbi:MAG: Rhodanese-like domain-containing protein [uncultured Campylobacterales bacterium]|uniref:Rhodanese-like domain-containing protein n=1 Tax=uncultured Campylobacterales bacterium TaxID=352960 RepID=A0A6S6S5F2_9BACT|nr:MAG: Rhodanese-like domain-containing protein [uncultured Campylobacterales bacterium]
MKIIFLIFTLCYSLFAKLTYVDVTELERLKLPIIDIRTQNEFKQTGTIPKAHKITFFDEFGRYDFVSWEKDLLSIIDDKNSSFVLVCRSGGRTTKVGTYLSDIGYKNIYHLKGGIKSWINKKD